MLEGSHTIVGDKSACTLKTKEVKFLKTIMCILIYYILYKLQQSFQQPIGSRIEVDCDPK